MSLSPSQYEVLSREILSGTSTVGYTATMTDTQVLTLLTAANQERNRSVMTGDEVFSNTAATEFANISDTKRDLWISFCGRETYDPFGGANVAFVQFIFGTGTQTISNLVEARVETVSRLTILGLPEPTEHQISVARS